MPKISWNDINDSDSSLSSDSQEPQLILPIKDKQESVHSIQQSKLKIACDKVSLAKLESHEKDEVWLFVPNSFYERADRVHQILEGCKQIKQLTRMKGVGWNILADYYHAKTLISQGIIKEEITIKFIYSTRNDNKPPQTQDKQKTPKMHKKVTYVQKVNNSPQLQRTISATDNIPGIQEIKKEEKLPELKELKSQRPKVKWVEKSNNKGVNEQKKSNANNYERLQSPRSPRPNRTGYEVKSPKRYVQKASEKKELQALEAEQKMINPLKQNQQRLMEMETVKVEQKPTSDLLPKAPEPEETMEVEPPKPCIEVQKQQKKEVVSESSSSDVEQQPKKKKNKKKKKTKNTTKNDKRDPNNPFSFFAQ